MGTTCTHTAQIRMITSLVSTTSFTRAAVWKSGQTNLEFHSSQGGITNYMWVTLDIFQTFHRVYYIFICLNELMMSSRLLKCCPNGNDVQVNSYVIGIAVYSLKRSFWGNVSNKLIKQGMNIITINICT